MFSSRLMLFPTKQCKNVKNKIRGGGGVDNFFSKTILSHFISRFMLFSTLKQKIGNIQH